jgi:hypothetical protein
MVMRSQRIVFGVWFAATIWCHIFKWVGTGVILLINMITLFDYDILPLLISNNGLENLGGEQLYYLFRPEFED